MKKRLLDWIVCPNCGERPRLQVFQEEKEEILEGSLSCACGLVYPVVDGIPRMLTNAKEEYGDFFARHGLAGVPKKDVPPTVADPRSSRSFGLQWTVYQEGDATWFKDDAGLRKREFLYNLDTTPDELRGVTLLDGGCGNGELTRAVAEYGPEIVAMDFSRSVENARKRLFEKSPHLAHRVHYLQGNILELPLRAKSFDMVHTSGVLHHTPSTYRAFRSISRAVKPGGKLYVQLYRRRPNWIHAVNVSLRAITTRLPMRLLYGLCYVASPAHAAMSRLMHFLRGEPAPPQATARVRAVQMFDNYSPPYQYRHTVPEIMELFQGEGYKDLKDVTLDNEARHMLAVLGRKKLEEETAAEPAKAAEKPAQPGSMTAQLA